MYSRVLETIEKENMLKAGDRVLCAVSGGADSMALLCVLYELKEKLNIDIYAANVNHSIRGEEGDADSRFVKDFCEKNGIELFYEKADIPKMAKKAQIGEEECGRNERYRFFNSVAESIGGALIATGHHMGDNAETLLFNLFRGSGGKGLGGICPKRDNIIRPLINVSKEEIKKYLIEKNIPWCEDSTNKECEYTRNKIRNVILSEIEKTFPKAVEKTASAARFAAEDNAYLEQCAEASGAFDGSVIHKDKFEKLPECLKRRVVVQALKKWNVKEIDIKKIEAVSRIAIGATGKGVDLGDEIRIVQSYGETYREEAETNAEEYAFTNGENVEISARDGVWSIKTVDKSDKMRDNKMMAVFDGELLPKKLHIRCRRDGDVMYPEGMDGKKKIKKIFIDLKIRKELRDKILMLATDDEVLFVPGIRKSAKYQPSEKTKKYLCIKFFAKNGK